MLMRSAAGAVQFYLVRAENACPNGAGTPGTDSDGVERDARTCPIDHRCMTGISPM